MRRIIGKIPAAWEENEVLIRELCVLHESDFEFSSGYRLDMKEAENLSPCVPMLDNSERPSSYDQADQILYHLLRF